MVACALACACGPSLPSSWPEQSPASAAASPAPVALVTRALESAPPLPGEPDRGWAGLSGEGSTPPRPHAHQHEREADAPTYVCPMHPDVTSDRPGQCPRCGMALVKREPAAPEAGAHEAGSPAGVEPDASR